jgi:hypothetical protein
MHQPPCHASRLEEAAAGQAIMWNGLAYPHGHLFLFIPARHQNQELLRNRRPLQQPLRNQEFLRLAGEKSWQRTQRHDERKRTPEILHQLG